MSAETPKSFQLSERNLKAALAPVSKELGGTDRSRLEAIVPLFKGEPLAKASLGDCLHKLFPGVETDKALTDFRAFRSRLNGNAQDAARPGEAPVIFEIDTKKGDVMQREVWFLGPDPADSQAAQFSEVGTSDLQPEAERVPLRAQPYQGIDLRTKIAIAFLSYAHDDKELVDDLWERVVKELHGIEDYTFEYWVDDRLLTGEDWHARIKDRVEGSHIGVLMASPSFLASDYIMEHEAPAFLDAQTKRIAFPAAIAGIDFDNMPEEFGSTQIFGYSPGPNDKRLNYAECTEEQKRAFAKDLGPRYRTPDPAARRICRAIANFKWLS